MFIKSIYMDSNRAIRDMLFVLYTAIVFVFFVFFANPYLEGISGMRWAADSGFYLDISKHGLEYANVEAINLINSIGPVAIAKIAGNNNLFIAFFNYVLFLASFVLLSSVKSVNQAKIFALMIINPMMLVSITTLNKEIIGFFVMSLLLYCLRVWEDNNKIYVLLLIASLLVRWQMLVVFFTFVTFRKFFTDKKWVTSRPLSILILLVIISIACPILRDVGFTESAEAWSVTDGNSFGTIYLLNELQNNYLFFLSFVPKALMNLVIIDPTIPSKIAEGASAQGYFDMYNYWIVPLHTIMTIITIVLSSSKSKFSLRKDGYYIASIYCVIFAISPFIQPRYFFPLYAILCLESSSNLIVPKPCLPVDRQ